MTDPNYRQLQGVATASESALPAYDAILINHANMAPDVPRGSIAFIEPPGIHGEGIYSVPFEERHLGDLRRLCVVNGGYQLRIDAWPEHGQPKPITRAELLAIGLRRVAGIARPFTNDFAEMLRRRF